MGSRREGELAAVIGVNVDIAMCQIACPHGELAYADADIGHDIDFAALHMLGDLRFAVFRVSQAFVGDALAADPDQFTGSGVMTPWAMLHDLILAGLVQLG